MTPAKPSLDLLRSLTDAHVLRALMDRPRLTRAELATITGISKPTVSESVRRLEAAELVRDTGERTTGRGGVGAYYALADDAGRALVVSIAPEGVVAETIDPHGRVRSRATSAVDRPATPARVRRIVAATARRAVDEVSAPVRLGVVSAADPVDRTTGRLVHLPDAPFLLGDLSPVDVLGSLCEGRVLVDNDVNWAARAERAARTAAASDPSNARQGGRFDNAGYIHLGEGLGCAVVSDGVVLRGQRGLAGEIAHLVTVGPGGVALAFTEVFAALGLRQPGTTAIDVDAVVMAVDVRSAAATETVDALVHAICGVLAAMVALADPEVIVLAGPWGSKPAVVAAVGERFQGYPRSVPVQAASVVEDPSLAGARHHAVDELRTTIADTSTRSPTWSSR